MLPKELRLRKENDFKRVFGEGKLFRTPFFDLRTVNNGLKFCRFGFIVGLKVSKGATQRNRLRRQLAGAVKIIKNQIKPGFDIVFIGKTALIGKKQEEIIQNFQNVFQEAKLLY